MTSIGTLVAFLVVSIGVIVLRRTRARPAARLQGAGLSGHADPLDRRLHLDHPGPARGDDLRLLRLGRRWRCVWYFFYGSRHSALGRAEAARREHAMTIVVGIAPDGRGTGGPAPGRACWRARRGDDLAALRGRPAAVAARAPRSVDAEYRAYLDATANEALEPGARAAARGRRRPVRSSTTRAPRRPACWRWPTSTRPTSSSSGRPPPASSGTWRWAASPTGCCTARPSRSRWRRAASAASPTRGSRG